MGFYAPHTLIDDAKRNGVTVLPVSLSRSQWESTLEAHAGAKAVRLGFSHVNGMSEKEGEALIAARADRPFAGFQDLVGRLTKRGVALRSATLKTLAVGDVFREFGLNQREALWKVLAWMAARDPIFVSADVQGELFREAGLPAMTEYEEVLSDYRSMGLSARGHPMKWVRAQMSGSIPDMNSQKAKLAPNGRMIEIPGLSLVMQRPPTAKGTAFATLEDEFGFLDLILHRDVYQEARAMMAEEPFVVVRGILQREGGAASLVVKRIQPFLQGGEDAMVAKFELSGDRVGQVRMPDSPGSIARRHLFGELGS